MNKFLIIGTLILSLLAGGAGGYTANKLSNQGMLGATSKTVFYNGNNPYFLTGNLGVGTANPTNKLQVVGTIGATDYNGTWYGLATSSFLSVYGSFYGDWDGLATTSFLAIDSDFLGTWDGYATNTLPYLSSSLASGLIFIGNGAGEAEASSTANLTGLPYLLNSASTSLAYLPDTYTMDDFTDGSDYVRLSTTSKTTYDTSYSWGDWNGNVDFSDDVNAIAWDGIIFDGDYISVNIAELEATSTITDNNSLMVQNESGIFKILFSTIKSVLQTAFNSVYLALAGGTMAGDIAMGSNDITGIDEIVIASSTLGTVHSGTWNGTAIDFSSYTNASASNGIQIDGNDIKPATGYSIPLTASSTNWESIYDTKLATSTFCYSSVASSSMADLEDQTIAIAPSNMLITKQKCKVKAGTSIVVNLSDGTNDMTSITCGTTLTNNFPSSNNAFTEGEEMQLEYGTNTGSSDYLTTICWDYIKN